MLRFSALRRERAAARRLHRRSDARILTAAFPYRWGVVQPVGHRTVNADGAGSNPAAPAIHSVAVSPGFSTG